MSACAACSCVRYRNFGPGASRTCCDIDIQRGHGSGRRPATGKVRSLGVCEIFSRGMFFGILSDVTVRETMIT